VPAITFSRRPAGIATEPLRDQLGMLDEIRLDSITPGISTFPAGQLDALEQGPFVGMARVGSSKEIELVARKPRGQ